MENTIRKDVPIYPLMFDYPRSFVADSKDFRGCTFELVQEDSFISALYRCESWVFTVGVELDTTEEYREKFGGTHYMMYNLKTHRTNYEHSALEMRDDDKLLMMNLPDMFSKIAGRLMDTMYSK